MSHHQVKLVLSNLGKGDNNPCDVKLGVLDTSILCRNCNGNSLLNIVRMC